MQARPAFRELPVRPLMIGLMPRSRFRAIIEAPAHRIGKTLEPALIDEILEDAPYDDALPLVAFTLRAMFESLGITREVKVHPHYRAIGGVRGAVAKVVAAIKHDAMKAEPSANDTRTLRLAFSKLVTVNDDLRFVRHKAAWSEIPVAARGLLNGFAARRYLRHGGRRRRDGDRRDHARKSIFEVWEELRGWLAEDREFYIWIKLFRDFIRLRLLTGEVLRGAQLATGKRWLKSHQDHLTADERALLRKSVWVERQRIGMAALVIAGLVGGFAYLAVQRGRAAEAALTAEATAERATRIAESRRVQARATAALAQDRPQEALLLAVEATRVQDAPPEVRDGLPALSKQVHGVNLLPAGGEPVMALDLSAEGKWLAATGPRRVRIYRLSGGVAVPAGEIALEGSVTDGAQPRCVFGEGDDLFVLHPNRTLSMYRADGAVLQSTAPRRFQGFALSMGGRLLTASDDESPAAHLVVWRLPTALSDEPTAVLPENSTVEKGARWSMSDNGRIALGLEKRTVVWDFGAKNTVARVLKGALPNDVTSHGIVDPTGRWIAAEDYDRLELWTFDAFSSRGVYPLKNSEVLAYDGGPSDLTFSPDGRSLVAAGGRVWRFAISPEGRVKMTGGNIFEQSSGVVSSPSGRLVVALYGFRATISDGASYRVFGPSAGALFRGAEQVFLFWWRSEPPPISSRHRERGDEFDRPRHEHPHVGFDAGRASPAHGGPGGHGSNLGPRRGSPVPKQFAD